MLRSDNSTLSILSEQQAHSRHKALIQAALTRRNRTLTTVLITILRQHIDIYVCIGNNDNKATKNSELISKEASVQTFHWLLEHYTLRTSDRLARNAEKALGEVALATDLTMFDLRTRHYIDTLQRHTMDANARLSVLTAIMIIQSAIPRHYSDIPWSTLERAIHLWDRLHYSHLALMKHASVESTASHSSNEWAKDDDYQFISIALRRELALHVLAEKWSNTAEYVTMIDRLFPLNNLNDGYAKLQQQLEHGHNDAAHLVLADLNQPFIPLNNCNNIRSELMQLTEAINDYARQHSIDGSDQSDSKRVTACPIYVKALERVNWSSIRRIIRMRLAWLFEQLPLQYNCNDTFLRDLQTIGIAKEDSVITKIAKWSIWNDKQQSMLMIMDVEHSNTAMNSQPFVKKLVSTNKTNDDNIIIMELRLK
ncbi:hypothetical protein BDF22DRAFT_700542 [Syncephalis plumigaleata]|nr:hypothetical protein BDF22DRAFT_700542 [Syncephalis plumigaleata]